MPGRVLVVDDDADTRDCLKDLLEDLGYEVDTASDGLEAVDLVKKTPQYELLLLDYRMPGLNGLETYEQIKEAGVEVHALLLSGFLSPGIEQRAKELGFCEVVQKPADVAALLKHIAIILAS